MIVFFVVIISRKEYNVLYMEKYNIMEIMLEEVADETYKFDNRRNVYNHRKTVV